MLLKNHGSGRSVSVAVEANAVLGIAICPDDVTTVPRSSTHFVLMNVSTILGYAVLNISRSP